MTASASDFAHTIRSLRLRAGLSQEELAERAGVSARAISDMERGLRKNPRPETLRLVAHALGLSDDERARFFASAHTEPLGFELRNASAAPRASEKLTTIPLLIRPLPNPFDTLIGRDDDVAAVVGLLGSGQARLVTLTGPGGVGKTRLCLEVAARLQDHFAEGIAFVDLAPLNESEQVGGAILQALGLDVDPRIQVSEALVDILRDRELLLILDNLEHVLDAAALLVDILLGSPSVNILVTSRVRLRLRGEHVYPVAPLPVPAETDTVSEATFERLLDVASVELFVERAGQARYGFALDAQNAGAVAEICRRLDGLPLAIELAAARVGMLPPEALLHRLSQLSGGSRDAPDRQQTLRDAIAWSYDLLGPQEQTVFRRLSVFAGGFTLAAAEEVACDGIAAPEGIELLAESSLLTAMTAIEGEARLTMLETVHSYAAELLEQSGEADSVRRRHADWCIGLAEIAGRDLNDCRNVADWFRRLDAEIDNFRSAIDFLLAAGDGFGVVQILSSPGGYWIDTIYLREVQQWYRQALPLTGDSPDESTVYGHCQFAFATALIGDLEQATTYAERFLDWAVSTTSPYALAAAYFTMGGLAEFAGDLERAIAFHERAAAPAREIGQLIWLLNSTLERGSSYLNAGQIDQAVAILDEGIARAREASAEDALVFGLAYRGHAALAQDDPALAATLFDEGLMLSQMLRVDRTTLSAIGGFAGVALALGRPDRAARLLGAVEAARQSGGIGRITEASLVNEIGSRTLAELGPERYNELLREGARIPYSEAIELAKQISFDAQRRPAQAK